MKKRKSNKLVETKAVPTPTEFARSTGYLTLEDLYRIVVALNHGAQELAKSELHCIQQKCYQYAALAGKIDSLHNDLRYSNAQGFFVKFIEVPKREEVPGAKKG